MLRLRLHVDSPGVGAEVDVGASATVDDEFNAVDKRKLQPNVHAGERKPRAPSMNDAEKIQ